MTTPVLLANGAWSEDLGNGASIEWYGCPRCGTWPPCPRWIAGGNLNCEPAPCRCEDIDTDPPQWKVERARRSGDSSVFVCDPYISKKGYNVGRWTNRCPCWGLDRDGRPDGCCAGHPHNPRYAELGPDGLPLVTTLEPAREAGWQAPHERAERRVEDITPTTAYVAALGMPVDDEPEPYVRRWTHAELHCSCATPWDHMRDKDGKQLVRGIGQHCGDDGCHRNFRNLPTLLMHRKTVLEPCRDPATIVDVMTGEPLLKARVDLGFTVWG